MEENLCVSELSNRVRTTCHFHLGQVEPSGKTIKDSEKPMTASQAAWGKDHFWQGRKRCFWVRMSSLCPRKKAVAFLDVSVLWEKPQVSPESRKDLMSTCGSLCFPHWGWILSQIWSVSLPGGCYCASNKVRRTTNQPLCFQEVSPSIL